MAEELGNIELDPWAPKPDDEGPAAEIDSGTKGTGRMSVSVAVNCCPEESLKMKLPVRVGTEGTGAEILLEAEESIPEMDG